MRTVVGPMKAAVLFMEAGVAAGITVVALAAGSTAEDLVEAPVVAASAVEEATGLGAAGIGNHH